MEIKLTKGQLKFLIRENLDAVDDSSSAQDVVKSYERDGHYRWFDHRNPEIKDIPESKLMYFLRNTLKYLSEDYGYKLKRVFVKDGEKIVGFLVYSETNEKKERIGDDESKKINVILSTAVDPEYRNRGLLKKMIVKSNIGHPFLVHTSHISPHDVWEKLGCKPILDRGNGNVVKKCG